jgi:hypothetical protein
VADLEGAHHDEVPLGDELCVCTLATPVEARVQLTFAQAERIERGIVGARRTTDVQ